IGGVESAFVEFDAFAQTFNDREAIVVHGRFHHLEDMVWIGMGGASNEGGPGGNELFHGVNRVIDSAPQVGFALEPNGRGGGGLLFGQPINPVVHDDVG